VSLDRVGNDEKKRGIIRAQKRNLNVALIMQVSFYILSISGLAYFLLAKRKFDWFAVAFFSASVYFLPGFFGVTAYLSTAGWVENPINKEAYGVMILVEFMILSGAVVNDLFFPGRSVFRIEKESGPILNIVFCLAVTGCLLMLLTTGAGLLFAEKQTTLPGLNRSHILYYTATMVGATMSFEYKRWKLFAAFCALILFDLFIGFRTSLAITAISILTLQLSKQGRRRLLIHSWRQVAAGVSLVLFLFLYQQVAYAVKIGNWDLLLSVLGEPNTYMSMVKNSEPFIAQSTLNEVTARHYSVGMGHLTGILYQFTLFAPELGFKSKSFNDLFQNDLFPEVTYGMANNIWAEMWSAGGWPLLFFFTIVFVLILKLFNTLIDELKSTLGAFVSVMASYWAFYIHRNDIGYAIVLEKRVLLVMILSLLIAILIREARKIADYSRRSDNAANP